MAEKYQWSLNSIRKFFFDYKSKIEENESVDIPADEDTLLKFFNALFDNKITFPFKQLTSPFEEGYILLNKETEDVDSEEFKKKKNTELKNFKELKNDEENNYSRFWKKFFEVVEPVYDIDKSAPAITAAEPVVSENSNKIQVDKNSSKKRYTFSLDDAKLFFEKNRLNINSSENDIEVHSNIDVYESMNIGFNNNMYINVPDSLNISETMVLVTDKENQNVVISGRIENGKKDGVVKKFFIARKENIDFDKLFASVKFNLILVDGTFDSLYESNKDISSINCSIFVKEIKINAEDAVFTDKPLCIDFGTSGTSAGSFSIKEKGADRTPELVEFLNVIDDTFSNICPTIVYVEDCSNRDEIKYLFGFEAKKRMIELEYCPEATIEFEIKKWVGAKYSDVVTIYDQEGNRQRNIQKRSIVKAYIKYIIDQAEDFFGVKFSKLHFTAPVKLKTSFIKFMERLLEGEYQVLSSKESVDEAVAVIFDYISKKNTLNMEVGSKESVIVIDCGGGTTDLVECDIELKQAEPYPVFNIINNSGNGDINFGGNNITYKIMQLLKIKTYDYINGLTRDVLEKSESFILETIDKMYESNESERYMILDNVYEDFLKAYEECEALIPTKFEADISDDRKEKVKRNFYYLWNFAEQIKIKFFGEDKVMVDKDTYLDLENTKKSSYIYLVKNNKLERFDNPFDEIKISIKEIRKLICGDIYLTLLKILPENPESYDRYFLSGQSCKINLFNELLKEFIPGKKLRNKIDESETYKESYKFKLNCINGSINYTTSQRSGNDGEKTIVTIPPKENSYSVRYRFSNDCSHKLGMLTDSQKELDLVIENLRDHSREDRTFVLPGDETYFITQDKESLKERIKNDLYFKDDDEFNETFGSLENNSDVSGRLALMSTNKDGYGFSIMFIKKDPNSNGGFDYRVSTEVYTDSFEKSMNYFFDGKR
ncbi:MAG: hypothetical protein Q4D76_16420 [Oscillospiraceae bacterium]|nr:hypothetical protein [Oscillospiraceae bacterium]